MDLKLAGKIAPVTRFAIVGEVAAIVAFVAGEPSSATNGAALRVDGRVVRTIP